MLPSLELVPAPAHTPTIGALVAMLTYTRATTLAAVEGLSVAALDHQHDAQANPIGAMLAHMAAIEWSYVAGTLASAPPAPSDWAEWGPFFVLGPAAWEAARSRTLAQHVERLATVRAQALEGLAAKDDAWLSQHATLPWLRGPATNLWAWYHVMEDELNHRGQVRWLRARLPESVR